MDITTPTLAEVKLSKQGGEGKDKDYSFSLWLPEQFQVGAQGCGAGWRQLGGDKLQLLQSRGAVTFQHTCTRRHTWAS